VPTRFEFAGAKQLLRLLDAVMAIGSEQSLADALRRITETAADLVDAEYAALGVLDESGSRLAEFITVGLSEEETERIGPRPEGHGILGLLILEPKPLRLPDLHAHPDSFGFPPGHPPMTSFLGVPIRLRGVVYGNLYLTDKADGQVFTDVDQELAVGLAAAAGLAIENARLHEQTRTAGLLEERERIARDLHDDVIQRLFATGLSLQAAAQMVSEPAAVERITRAVDDLDTSIRQVRSTIFELHQRWSARLSLRADIVGICDESAKAIGFKPSCDIAGPIDSAVTEPTRGHLLLCLREALSNVARHARATAVQVDVSVDQGFLSLRVADDGVGYQPTPDQRSSGLDNMRVRAEALGGAFAIEVRPQGGTLATWEVPLAPEGSSPDEIGTQGPT
jgi:signal transduction histidine kinase